MDAGYTYANTPSAADTGFLALFTGVYLMIILVLAVISIIAYIIAYWRIYTKAGEPGWGAIVPFYSYYLLFKIAWGNGWFFLFLFVPVANLIVTFIVYYKLCVAFGHGVGFYLGMLFLSPIFMMILAFDSSEYMGPA